MKGLALIGVVLILLGLAGLVWPVISYTDTDTVADFGPVEITAEDREHIPTPPLAAGAAVVVGVVLVGLGRRRPAAGGT